MAHNRAGETMNKTLNTPLSGDAVAEAPGSTDTPDPREVREKTGLSREEMAGLMGMGDYGYSAWERGIRTPGGPARKLLALIATDPAGMVERLQSDCAGI